VASFVGHQEIDTGKILTIQKKFAKLEAVTANDLQQVAKDIFVNEKLNLALIGPFKDKRRFEKILKF
jgi:predicted Zn-dependent peptidase